jgi:hypothetical protein
MEKPKYTLLFNASSCDGFISRVREFYTSPKAAIQRCEELNISNKSPLLRPYSAKMDRKYLV